MKWIKTSLNNLPFLSLLLKDLFDVGPIEILVHSHVCPDSISRKDFDGVIAVTGNIHGQEIGVIHNDFKVKGGSYGVYNSQIICEFLRVLGTRNTPVIFVVNSIGARIMEGRKVFPFAFDIFPALKGFLDSNLLITISIGRSLGLGALFFELGDYRLALEKEALLNLTGPMVMDLFFGTSVDFNDIANAPRQFKNTEIIHHIFKTKKDTYKNIRDLLGIEKDTPLIQGKKVPNPEEITAQQKENEKNLQKLLRNINKRDDDLLEIFPQIEGSVRTYILKHGINPVGIMINPPGPHNMIDLQTVRKYRAALNLYKKLKLPIISIVDTPGIDPRVEQSDQGIIHAANTLTLDIIDYPYPKLGIGKGRCFGGASVLTLPAIFGGEKTLAITGSNIGIMHRDIIQHLLSKSNSLHKEWCEHSQDEQVDLSDLIDKGIIEKVVDIDDLYPEIEGFLTKARSTLNPEMPNDKANLSEALVWT